MTHNIMGAIHNAMQAKMLEVRLVQAADALALDTEALLALNKAARDTYMPAGGDDLMANTHATAKSDMLVATDETTLARSEDIAHRIAEAIAGRAEDVSEDELASLPSELAPQLTATRMRSDMPGAAGPAVLSNITHAKMAKAAGDDVRAKTFAAMAWQGLDMCDLDEITYAMLSANPASMGHWFEPLRRACETTNALRVPKTTIRRVPIQILQMSRIGYETLTPTTLAIVDAWAREAFDIDVSRDHFVRTGCYSSKYEFANAHVPAGQESAEIGQYLLWLSAQAAEMAGPLQERPTIGVSTTNEWVVREWIDDVEGNPTIYGGMPLHTEFRTFVDCDRHLFLGMCPYWREDVMEDALLRQAQMGNERAAQDFVTYRAWKPTLNARYEKWADTVRQAVTELLDHGLSELSGQWSLDIMLNGDTLWAIDMAPAARSALCDCIDPALLAPATDPDWVSALPQAHTI